MFLDAIKITTKKFYKFAQLWYHLITKKCNILQIFKLYIFKGQLFIETIK